MDDQYLNPFNWVSAIVDGVPRREFSEQVTRILKGGTHVSMLGPRGLGKTTFVQQELRKEIEAEQGHSSPKWKFMYIDLRNVISMSAFIVAIVNAISNHPDISTRTKLLERFSMLEKDLGIDFKVIKAGLRMPKETQEAILSAQLTSLATVFDRLVIVFDEFQILANVPGGALSSIRVHLMGAEQHSKVSLVLTGSLRGKLEAITKDDKEAIWEQTHSEDIPGLPLGEFSDYLRMKFRDSGRPVGDDALLHLLHLTKLHPKRTQQLAWYVWQSAKPGADVVVADVQKAFDNLLKNKRNNAEFTSPVDNLLTGGGNSINEYRVLFLIAAKGSVGSRLDAEQYGLTSEMVALEAARRLAKKGMVSLARGGKWQIVDPLVEAWLKEENPVIHG